uniref:NADAR domain protein n=1 Tax=Marseillevirus LCMAC102 TaxID=2506603 RepID=A0A481YSV2_9VIRU|nr:MAG: NADAR domain protein [Marseillevirus LCMAC102]
MDVQKIIKFSNPKDDRTGFLSNASNYGFILDDKRWPTVEHFIHAKKFDGTQYEEEIRVAPTVHQAKRMATFRYLILFDKATDKILKRKIYGNPSRQEIYYIREDWNAVESIFLEQAIREKIMQNRRLQQRLLDTHDATLIDENNPLTGKILERIRTNLKKKVSKSFMVESIELKDLCSATLTTKDIKLIRGLILLSIRISKLEGWNKKIHQEMIEDALYNLVPTQIINYIKTTTGVSWTVIYRDLPNYEQIINEIYKIFKRHDPSQENQISSTVFIAAFVRWVKIKATSSQKKELYDRLKNVKTLNIVFPKQKRWYRTNPPYNPGVKRKGIHN